MKVKELQLTAIVSMVMGLVALNAYAYKPISTFEALDQKDAVKAYDQKGTETTKNMIAGDPDMPAEEPAKYEIEIELMKNII